MKVHIGTSGFQYPEWKGTFYPDDLPPTKMLGYYSERFSTTEINYTFHRIPSAKTIDNWCSSTPRSFHFALKAPQKVTHFARLRNCDDTLTYFFSVIASLEQKLGPVLFQLPPGLKKDAELLRSFLGCLPPTLRAAFEFRHDSWLDDETYELLRARNVALCVAESEKLATPLIRTASYGYLRLRREDYDSADITRWAAAIHEQASNWSDAFIYFKHEESGIGPKLARQLQESLPST